MILFHIFQIFSFLFKNKLSEIKGKNREWSKFKKGRRRGILSGLETDSDVDIGYFPPPLFVGNALVFCQASPSKFK